MNKQGSQMGPDSIVEARRLSEQPVLNPQQSDTPNLRSENDNDALPYTQGQSLSPGFQKFLAQFVMSNAFI